MYTKKPFCFDLNDINTRYKDKQLIIVDKQHFI